MDPQTADGVVRIIEAFGQSNLAVIGLTLTLVWWMLKSFKSAITQRQDDQEKTLDRIHSCLLAMLANQNQNEEQKNTTVAYRFPDRSWSGFAGGAVWSTRAKPGTLDKLSRDHGISVDDFESPRLVAMLCYQNRGNWRGNIGAPKGFTEELYAHRIDEQVLKIVGFFLEAENPPGVEAGLIVETSANRP